jgi:hypothetical protein
MYETADGWDLTSPASFITYRVHPAVAALRTSLADGELQKAERGKNVAK